MDREFAAHIRTDGAVQTVAEHCRGTARLAGEFAIKPLRAAAEYIGMLHDIGKYRQYEEGVPHEISSTEIAETVLSDMPADICFSGNEQQIILTAITGHRKLRENPAEYRRSTPLNRLLPAAVLSLDLLSPNQGIPDQAGFVQEF